MRKWKLWLLIVAVLCGCNQRQVKYYEYDEIKQVHKQWQYKSNSLASKQELDWLHLDLPDKGKLWFGPYIMDNDSFKGGYGPFWMGTSPKKGD